MRRRAAMPYKSTEAQRAYWREYHAKKRALKPKRVLKSKYRFVNDGKNNGLTAHKVIAEKAIGHTLPKGAEVHHIDNDGHNNANTNLVVCPDHAYHALLHLRTQALDACGNPDWRRCSYCRKYDDIKNMSLHIPKDQTSPRACHAVCRAASVRERRHARKAA